MLTRHFRFNIVKIATIDPFYTLLALHFSLPTRQTYMFRVAKDKVLPSKRPSFTTRKLSFRRVKHICFRS